MNEVIYLISFNVMKSAINKNVEKKERNRRHAFWEEYKELRVMGLDVVTSDLGPPVWAPVSNGCSQRCAVGMTVTSFKGGLPWPVYQPSGEGGATIILCNSFKL